MKLKKSNSAKYLLEGLKSAFDLFGSGFKPSYKPDSVEESWTRVGKLFSKYW